MQEQNLAEVLRNRSTQFADRMRWRQSRQGGWITATFADNQRQIYEVMAGLHELGLRKGDTVGILANTSCEWMVTDWAIMVQGAVTVTIYPSLLPETIAFIANDSQMKYLFIEDREQYDKLMEVRSELEGIERVIVYDPTDVPPNTWMLSYEQLRQLHSGSADERAALATELSQSLVADDLATVVYTSGTTGDPKGAMLPHRAFLAQMDALRDRLPQIEPGDTDLLFLPLAHIFGRLQHIVGVDRAFDTAIVESMKTVIDDIQQVKPKFFFSVPRIYEKMFSVAKGRAAAKPTTRTIFNWALNVGRTISQHKQNDQPITGVLKLKQAVADKLVFSKIRNLLGGNITFAITGGAPLDIEILEFFVGAGVLLLEGWGLTETTAAATVNTPTEYRLGTVGKPITGAEVKIADDGEILIRGPMVLTGYYNSPKKTAEDIRDGWFYTGDIGEIDRDGYVRITDRKKDLIVTAAGKNIAPQAVEAAFKNSPYISQCAVYGDRKPYLVALLTLDAEGLTDWAASEGVVLDGNAHEHPKVKALIEQEVQTANSTLPRFEQIKYYRILPEDFSVDNGLLTPTLKLRRRYIYDQFKDDYADLYTTAA